MSEDPDESAENWVIRLPSPVTLLIVSICVISVAALSFPEAATWRYRLGLLTADFRSATLALPSAASRLVTYAFVHGGYLHLFMNTVFLFCFGAPVVLWLRERATARAAIVFLSLFLGASIVGGALAAWLLRATPLLIVGASAGVFGVFGALVRIGLEAPEGRDWRRQPLLELYAGPVVAATVIVIGLNLIQADFWPAPIRRLMSFGGNMRILWQAHIIGYLAGLLSFPLLCRIATRR
jgi:membrane associated rhomboid family serine protease